MGGLCVHSTEGLSIKVTYGHVQSGLTATIWSRTFSTNQVISSQVAISHKWKLDHYSASFVMHSTEKVKLICLAILLEITGENLKLFVLFIFSNLANFSPQFGKYTQTDGRCIQWLSTKRNVFSWHSVNLLPLWWFYQKQQTKYTK